jgi:hypothetical protein
MKQMAKLDAEEAAQESSEPEPEKTRDPRMDPIVGDVVRIPWKDGTQLRRVTGTLQYQYRDAPRLVQKLHWDDGALSGGSKISIASWRKLAKDGEIVQRGEGTGVLTWMWGGSENPIREIRLAETAFKWRFPTEAAPGTSTSLPPHVELAERNPLVDPAVGDVVRIPWGKGGTQERVVRRIVHYVPNLPHREHKAPAENVNIYWHTPDRGKGDGKARGSKVSLKSWRKLAKGGEVLTYGEGSKAVVWESALHITVENPNAKTPTRALPGTIANVPPFHLLLDRDGQPVRHESFG